MECPNCRNPLNSFKVPNLHICDNCESAFIIKGRFPELSMLRFGLFFHLKTARQELAHTRERMLFLTARQIRQMKAS